ncbi:nuclear factor erythroid 2-related factor 3 isoform X2 [Melanerpes formicivorus]|uniref:nuclear factor erythroid 2-related factor 3 isoform X2 n=1 Tax=Melanerpes formicivorus TaxID=211600 RepID=UPI00358E299E
MAEDVDLKAYQEALANYCPHQGGDQLELQEDEEDTNQSNHNCGDSLFSLEGCFQLLSSQMENMLEVNLLEDTQVATSGRGQEPSSSHCNVSLAQTLFSHYFRPHEATLLKTDHPMESHSETRHSQRQDCCPQSDSSITDPEPLLHGSHMTGLFPATDIGNLTAPENDFDKIKSVSLALEDSSDPIEVSQLFEESGLDLALCLNSSHSTASYSTSSEGAIGYNSNTNSASSCGLEAIGGHSQEHTKYDHVEHAGDSECSRKATLKQFLHKHTYQLPSQAASTPVHQQLWMKPSKEVKDKCCNTTGTKLSSDEHPTNSPNIPFSAEEIVSMPVDSFNTMLAKNQLTDTQVSLLRGIRRRGKNKVAAQNCRKRKLKAILKLEEAVCDLQTQKESLIKERSQCSRSISRLKQELKGLYRDIFSHLKDDQGRPVNPCQYVMHCSSDGSFLLLPKYLVKPEQKQDNKKEQKQN